MDQGRQKKAGRHQEQRKGVLQSVDRENKPEYLTPDKQKFLVIRDHLLYFEKESKEWYEKNLDSE